MSIVTRLDRRSAFFVLLLATMFVSPTVGAARARGEGDGEFQEHLHSSRFGVASTQLSRDSCGACGQPTIFLIRCILHGSIVPMPGRRWRSWSKHPPPCRREVRLRDRQSGAISDARVRQMLEWCDEAITRVRRPSPSSSFRPDRLHASRIERGDSFSASSLFGDGGPIDGHRHPSSVW